MKRKAKWRPLWQMPLVLIAWGLHGFSEWAYSFAEWLYRKCDN